jgi:hypothetical protein
MRNLTYWVANSHDDPHFNLRASTKHGVELLIDTYDPSEGDGFDKPRKVTIPYSDLIDLVNWTAGEEFED